MVPVKLGAPLVAWDTLTLDHLWEIALPADGESEEGTKFHGVVTVLYEFLDLCIDWDRVILSVRQDGKDSSVTASAAENVNGDIGARKAAVEDAVRLLVAGAVRSGASKEAQKEVDKDRSGIAMWRIP